MLRRSVATVSLSGTLEEKLAAVAQVGFDGVEIFESDLVSSASTPEQIRRRATDLGLRLELYQPFRDFEAVPPDVLRANLARARRKFDLMTALGIDTLLVCSSVAEAARDDDALAAEQLHGLATLAAGYGIRIAYEALAWGRHVRDYTHAWKIVASGDHPNLGVCLDSFHILSRRLDPGAIRDIPGEKIFFLQLADAPRLMMDVLQWSRHYRCFPGQGGFDLVGFLDHVLAAGYQGPLSLEIFNDVFRQADAGRTATDALRSLIVLEEGLRARQAATPPAASPPTPPATPPVASAGQPAPAQGQGAPAQGQGAPAQGRERARLAVPPPAAPLSAVPPPAAALSGFAFVEIAVDPLAELAAEHLLQAMGFAKVGQHRTKPVQMWRQAQAHILLNRDRGDADRWSHGEAAVAAIGVECDDPARCGRRAEALLAPAIPRRYGPQEADLFAVAAPDGTAVFFCGGATDGVPGWLGDFVPVEVPASYAPGSVTRVDHVGLSQPAYYFDEASLFYQSVLGLRQQASAEIPDPYGLVRSRAVSAPGGAVRFVLTVPALGGGRLPESAEFQHVALSCPDIFAAAVDMRVRRLPILPIPDNYYDDLTARLDVDGALAQAMRTYGVLYDRDEGGEFFHFYTAMLGRRMFFEIVQRVGDYEGYGTPNTPVRMAAQYRHAAWAGIAY